MMDHMLNEHRKTQEPILLNESDLKIETWVGRLLEYQTEIISKQPLENNGEDPESIPSVEEPLSQAEIQLLSSNKCASQSPMRLTSEITRNSPVKNSQPEKRFNLKELEQAFGDFGVPNNKLYSCPKCEYKVADVMKLTDHLEMELAKVR